MGPGKQGPRFPKREEQGSGIATFQSCHTKEVLGSVILYISSFFKFIVIFSPSAMFLVLQFLFFSKYWVCLPDLSIHNFFLKIIFSLKLNQLCLSCYFSLFFSSLNNNNKNKNQTCCWTLTGRLRTFAAPKEHLGSVHKCLQLQFLESSALIRPVGTRHV